MTSPQIQTDPWTTVFSTSETPLPLPTPLSVLVLGDQGTGKSLLVDRLESSSSNPPSEVDTIIEDVGLDYTYLVLDDDSIANVWQIQGDEAFADLLRFPLAPTTPPSRILILLVVDVTRPLQGVLSLTRWESIVQRRLESEKDSHPELHWCVVVTHADRLPTESVDDRPQLFQFRVRQWCVQRKAGCFYVASGLLEQEAALRDYIAHVLINKPWGHEPRTTPDDALALPAGFDSLPKITPIVQHSRVMKQLGLVVLDDIALRKVFGRDERKEEREKRVVCQDDQDFLAQLHQGGKRGGGTSSKSQGRSTAAKGGREDVLAKILGSSAEAAPASDAAAASFFEQLLQHGGRTGGKDDAVASARLASLKERQ